MYNLITMEDENTSYQCQVSSHRTAGEAAVADSLVVQAPVNKALNMM